MLILDSNGVSIAYEAHGAGDPLILLHGFTSSFRQNWHATGWVDFLTQHGYRIVGVDLRGHGNSAKLYRPEAYTTAAMAGDSVVRDPRFKDAVITFLRQSAP